MTLLANEDYQSFGIRGNHGRENLVCNGDQDDETILKAVKKAARKFIPSSDDESDVDESVVLKTNYSVSSSSKDLPVDNEDECSASDNDEDKNTNSPRKNMKRIIRVIESSEESDFDEENIPPITSHNKRLSSSLVYNSPGNSDGQPVKKVSDSDHGQLTYTGTEEDSSDSDSSTCDDDSGPPLRIFRNKNAAARNDRGYDSGSDLSDAEEHASSSPRLSGRTKRRSMPSTLEIKSETQRLIRESNVNLPYHVPEAKKLSDFLKRPVSLQNTVVVDKSETRDVPTADKHLSLERDELPSLEVNDASDSGVGFDTSKDNGKNETQKEEKPLLTSTTPAQSKKAQLLALKGIVIPSLNIPKPSLTARPGTEFVHFGDDEATPIDHGVSGFMQRLIKQSTATKRSLAKKKVQFNIVKKEERSDGSGTDLVSDVVTHEAEEGSDSATAASSYKNLREKLAARMKERRSVERKKREEIYKLDNEELGTLDDDDKEEDLDDDWSDEDSDRDEEIVKVTSAVDKSKNHVINDDEDDEIEETTDANKGLLDALQRLSPDVSLSNASVTSKTSQHTSRSDILFPHLPREGSMLLFEDSIKKSVRSHEDLTDECTANTFDSSSIPPNQPELSDISESSKPARLNTDEDSYFYSERSQNTSANDSQSRLDYESQFLDSDGFIKEQKTTKSLSSLFPPGGEDDNANDYNMSQLLELCSGKFQESAISQERGSDLNPTPDIHGALIDESFGFQVEPDSFRESKVKDFSDDEHSNDEESDEEITIVRKKKDFSEKILKDFMEDEAELSGDDVGSDDDEEDNNEDFYEEEANDEILPKEEIIHQQVNKVHLKQLLDQDQREIDLLQEVFVDENVDTRRNRKFRWKNIDENMAPNYYLSDDEDDENCSVDEKEEEFVQNEESQWRMLRLEREEFFDSKTSDGNLVNVEAEESDSQLLKMGRSAMRRSSRVLSDINEDSRGNGIPTLRRSSSFNVTKLPSRNSFLSRKPEVLSKFASFKDPNVIKGAVNSDRMIFKAVSPSKKQQVRKPKRPQAVDIQVIKKPRLDEDSNSIFDLFET